MAKGGKMTGKRASAIQRSTAKKYGGGAPRGSFASRAQRAASKKK